MAISNLNTENQFFGTGISKRKTRTSKSSRKVSSYLISERIIILAISISIAFPIVETLINVFLNVKFWDSFVMYGIYYGILILSIYYSLKRFRITMIGIPSLFIAIWFCSYFFFPENRIFLLNEIFLPLITLGIPLFISVIAVRDYKKLYTALRFASIASVIAGSIFFLLQIKGKYEIDYMTFSYSLILPVMLMWIFCFQNRKSVDFLLALAGTAIAFLMGARGPFLGLICGILFYFLINFKFTVRNLILLLIAVFIIGLIITNFDLLLQSTNDFLQKKNISSRTISLLLNNKVEQLSGRNEIYSKAFSLGSGLFIGKGMAGDRVALGGTYAHNFFLEVLLEYGLVLGFIFIFYLMFYLIKTLFFVKNKRELYYFFIAIFFTTGFLKLQFSYSYTLEPTFLIMIALIVRLNYQKRIKKPFGFKKNSN